MNIRNTSTARIDASGNISPTTNSVPGNRTYFPQNKSNRAESARNRFAGKNSTHTACTRIIPEGKYKSQNQHVEISKLLHNSGVLLHQRIPPRFERIYGILQLLSETPPPLESMLVETYHKLQTLVQEIERISLKTRLIALKVLAIDSQAKIRPIQLIRGSFRKKNIHHKINMWNFLHCYIIQFWEIGRISLKKRLIALKVLALEAQAYYRAKQLVRRILRKKKIIHKIQSC